ncbi:MAG TPA: hypothetical protein VGL95_03360 [Acetobacteraceae bacterium]
MVLHIHQFKQTQLAFFVVEEQIFTGRLAAGVERRRWTHKPLTVAALG